MYFNKDKPIYLQIEEILISRIVASDDSDEMRIPSARDLALEFEVNPNTMVKVFIDLENQGIIYKKRGIGYFVSPEAKSQIYELQRLQFINTQIPEFLTTMKKFKIQLSDLEKYIEE